MTSSSAKAIFVGPAREAWRLSRLFWRCGWCLSALLLFQQEQEASGWFSSCISWSSTWLFARSAVPQCGEAVSDDPIIRNFGVQYADIAGELVHAGDKLRRDRRVIIR